MIYASRPGADAERKVVAEALAKELAAEHSDELKTFVTRQLQLCGRVDDVPAIAELLGSDRLCEPATQALLAIGGKAAQQALKSALGSEHSKGTRQGRNQHQANPGLHLLPQSRQDRKGLAPSTLTMVRNSCAGVRSDQVTVGSAR